MRPHPSRTLAAALAAAVVATVLADAPAQAAPAPPPTYLPPVDAPVVDGFRPPANPYGPGNRGLEYATTPGTPVVASAGGQVVFAGAVARSLHVTVLHADGLRTSYSFLSELTVHRGQNVAQGDVLGIAGPRLHFGARSGDAYLDPAGLFGAGPARVHLVPFDDPPGEGPGAERRALLSLLDGGRAITGRFASWMRGAGADGLALINHYAVELSPTTHAVRITRQLAERLSSDAPCTPASLPGPRPPATRRIAVLVGGLGSSSSSAAIDDVDTAALGFAAPDVVRFSYAGGRTPDPTDAVGDVEARPYTATDSEIDLYESGRRLAELLEVIAAANPGVGVDVLAHSQGGIVVRLALAELERRGHLASGGVRIDLVATLGTPHGGAQLATAAAATRLHPGGSLALDTLAALVGVGIDPGGASVTQMGETSSLIAELDSTPLPRGIRALTIGARGDLVVPSPKSSLDGATSVVVPLGGPTAHDALPGSSEATREIALALANLPPGCESSADAALDVVIGDMIGWTEDLIGAGALATA